MKYCSRCLYPENHPLNITFDDNGVCSGCRVHEEKDILDWDERFEKLRMITDQYKTKTRNIHDCIVPVTGARDSYFILHTVKNVLKLNPLIVHYNKQYNTSIGIRNLSYLRSLVGTDFITQIISPDTVKKITQYSLRKFGSMYWHCIAGSTVFPVHIAVKFKIPLIIWGVHQGCDQVGMFSHLDEVEMMRKYRKEHDLMGYEAEDLINDESKLTSDELEPYIYPHDKELEAVGVRGIYLNNYIRWDSKRQHEKMIKLYGYKTTTQQRTFDTYNDIDCFHYSGLHDYIKLIKHGYGKVTDHVCREIRLGRISREIGKKLVKKYQYILPDDIKIFCEWINMSKSDLQRTIKKHKNCNIWRQRESEWELIDPDLFSVGKNKEIIKQTKPDKDQDYCNYEVNAEFFENKNSKKYILLGRGWD